MNIYLDITNLLAVRFLSGIQRVVTEYALRLAQAKSCEVTFIAWDAGHHVYRIVEAPSLFERIKSLSGASALADVSRCGCWNYQDRSETEKGIFLDLDAVWNPGIQKRGYLYGELKKNGIPLAVLVHDIIPVQFPQFSHPYTVYRFYDFLAAAVNYADVLLTTTDTGKRKLQSLVERCACAPKRIEVVGLGANVRLGSPDDDGHEAREDARQAVQSGKYLLMVSTIEPRKNHSFLLDCFEQFLIGEEINLVLAGRIGWKSEQLEERIRHHALFGKRIFFIEGASDDTIDYLYRHAFLFVFPSYDEGYGLPIIEALGHGLPALVSDIPVFHEIGTSYCDYFSLDDASSLAKCVQRYLSHPSQYREKKRAISAYRPPSWEDSVKRSIRVLESIPFGDMDVIDALEQVFILSARVEELVEVLRCIERDIPFIRRALIAVPGKLCDRVRKAYSGALSLDFLPDEEILAGVPLPEDHTPRNFLLRCLAMKSDKLDNAFLMHDDDYRPLAEIHLDDFIRDGKYIGYYFYDLRYWCGTMRQPTSFDRGMYRTLRFLQQHAYPTLQYASHMPQVIDKRIFLRILEDHPGIAFEGYDEWSIYFNYARAHYPRQLMSKPFKSLCWPMLGTDWELMCLPDEYLFENFYPELYERHNFRGLPMPSSSDTRRTIQQKILRKHTEELLAMHHRRMGEVLEQFARYALNDQDAPRGYLLCLDGDELRLIAPKRFFSRVQFCTRPHVAMVGFAQVSERDWDMSISYRFEPVSLVGAPKEATQKIAHGLKRASMPIVSPNVPGSYRLLLCCKFHTLHCQATASLDAWIYEK